MGRMKKNADIETNIEPVKVVVSPKAEVFNEPLQGDGNDSYHFVKKPVDYTGWVSLTVHEAEELGLAGKLIKHDPFRKMGLVAKD